MTRAMRQLWQEREHFMQYDRGWNSEDAAHFPDNISDDLPDDFEHLDLSGDEEKAEPKPKPVEKETDDPDIQRRLDAVDSFYVSALSRARSDFRLLFTRPRLYLTYSPSLLYS
jgi:hypothetical protein